MGLEFGATRSQSLCTGECVEKTGELEQFILCITDRLTILPRLNSLNHDPGISFGHEDILTCGKQTKKGTLIADINTAFCHFFLEHGKKKLLISCRRRR